jgi:AraC-like DNA-binding protein
MDSDRENNINCAELENIAIKRQSSFNVGKYCDAYFRRPWHYHPEFEILLITKGFGTRMTGDHFEPFEEGDLILLGGNLPHAWISDAHFLKEDNNDVCESIFIQFRKSVFGTHFIDMPEMESIRTILTKAERGLKIEGNNKTEITKHMLSLEKQSPLEQMLTLIRILDLMHQSEYKILASNNYAQRGIFKSPKMTKAHNYIMQNFKHEIDINSCAQHLGMTTPSFCRFFKKQSNVTFSVYLNYMRINFAQKLLRKTELPIKEIAFECGYVSVVYFNQKYKKMTDLSPREFRRNQICPK